MKKILLYFLFSSAIFNMQAQFLTGKAGIYYNEVGKSLAIGTIANSAYKLYSYSNDASISFYSNNIKTSTSATYGIKSNCSNSNSGAAYGLYSNVSTVGTGDKYAIYGTSSNNASENVWAGYFNGRGYFSGKVGTGSNSKANTINYDLQLLNNSSKIAFGDNNYIGYENGGVNCFVGEYGSTSDGTAGDTDILHLHGKKGIYFSVGNKGEKKDIKFMIGADGIAYAKAVNVTLAGWPDYVFEAGYDLKSLEDVEKHIKENKHLPDVPSEKEIVENGVDLGEMNKILLQKIEELTLYIIEQNKRIEALENNKDN